MSGEVTAQSEILLRISIESLRDCREDMRSIRSFAGATIAVPSALLFSDSGLSHLGITLSVLAFALGAAVMMPTRVTMITNPTKVRAAFEDGSFPTPDAAVRAVANENIHHLAAVRTMLTRKRLLWLLESVAAAGALVTFVVTRL